MRVVILADEFFASRERAMLERLEVGLADEGVRLVHALPETLPESGQGRVFLRTVRYSPKTLAITRGLAVARLARDIEGVEREEGGGLDIIHVFGGSAWELGRDLAEELGSGLALEVWRSGLVSRCRELSAREGERPLLLAPDPAIERALQRAAPTGSTVRLAAWGVHASSDPREVLPADRAPSAMIVGSGRDVTAFQAALRGIAQTAKARPDLLIFCDAKAARRAELWPLARRLGILHQLSLIDELEGRRDLLLQGDILVQPDSHGESRSTVLEAMASGLIVAAAADSMVSVLQDGRTARLVPSGDEGAWARVINEILADPARSRGLTQSALEFVRTERRASDQVRAVLSAYQWIVDASPGA